MRLDDAGLKESGLRFFGSVPATALALSVEASPDDGDDSPEAMAAVICFGDPSSIPPTCTIEQWAAVLNARLRKGSPLEEAEMRLLLGEGR